MARWSSWFVASLVLALLFVTSDCLRGSSTHIVGQETSTTRSRGGSRFNTAKVEKKLETTPEPFTAQSRSNRRGNSVTTRVNDSTTRHIKSHGDTITYTTSEKSTIQQLSNPIRRRNGVTSRRQHSDNNADLTRAATEDRRYLPDPSSRKLNKQIDDNTDLQLPHESSRTNHHQSNGSLRSRSTHRAVGKRIDTTAPSASASDVPRSRTGRKIQPTLSPRNFTVSNKYSSRSSDTENAQGSIESKEQQPRTTSKRPSRRLTERSTQRHDVSSSSDKINADNKFQTEITTNYPQENNLPRSKETFDNRKSNKSRESSSSLRNNRRGVVKVIEDHETSRKKLRNHSESQFKSRELESTPTTDAPPRNRGRSLSVGEPITDKKQRKEEFSRIIKKSKTPQLNNDTASLSTRTRLRTRIASASTNITAKSRINQHSTTVKPLMTTEVNTENTTIVFSPSETIETITNIPVTVNTPSISSSPSPRISVASSISRKTAASSLSIKTLPKEDFFNHGLGFRGRKFNTAIPQTSSAAPDARNNQQTTSKPHGNPGWTLQRRPAYKNEENVDASSTVSTISNEIPSSNDGKTALPNGSRRRGNQTFNKASVILKIDREVDEGDNYPPEFKAKIAQLKNTGVKDGGSKSPSGASKDDDPLRRVVVINRRQLRSTDYAKREETESHDYPEVNTINPITPVPEQPNNSEMLDGRKKFTLGSNDSSRTIQKISSGRRLDATRISSTSSSSTLSINPDDSIEHKSLRATKRQSSFSRTSTTTPRAIETVTLPKVDQKIARTSMSIERGSVRVGETSHVRQNRKEITTTSTKNPIVSDSMSTTINPVQESSSEQLKSKSIKSRDAFSRSKNPTDELTSTTTRRSRAWNTAYIDKNWQEPTTVSSTDKNVVLPTSTKRSRVWNVKHIDKNWQAPTTVSSTDKNVVLPTSTKRSRVWNIKHIDKNWQEPTKKPESNDEVLSTTVKTIVNTANKYTRKMIDHLKSDKSILSTTTEMSGLSMALPLRSNSRPRTATYRRHSEISPIAMPQQQTPDKFASIAITPRYHASIKSQNTTQRSVRQEPTLALQISNITMINNSTNSTGISLSSRGKSGNSDSNIFNPTKATFLINSNVSLLEQLRSTVAPLLGVLGAKSPVFKGVYQNFINSSSNEQRVTPSGSPPRFSARYRGAELLVRKPNVIDSSGLSQTTPLTPTQNEKSPSLVSVSSPGEPNVLTFYRALETASIRNELVQTDSNTQQQQQQPQQQQEQQLAGAQVDTSSVVTDLNFNGSSNANNDTTTSSTTTTTTTTTENILTNLVPVITTVNSLTMVMDSQTPDTASTQSSDLTQTPEISTSMPSTNGPVEMIRESMNPQPINNSSADITTTPQLIMETVAITTESISTIPTTDMALSITTDDSSTMRPKMEIMMGDLVETTTTQSTTVAVDSITTFESTTVGAENSTMESSTIVPMMKNIPMNVTKQFEMSIDTTTMIAETTTPEMMSITTESVVTSMAPMIITDGDIPATTKSLEILAQFGNSTTSQVMVEDIIGTTVIPLNETDDSTAQITTMGSDTTTIIPLSVDSNSTEVNLGTVTEVSESIDEALMTQMMKRLMDLFSLEEFVPQSQNNSDLGRMLGGFLDNSDRNISMEITTVSIPIETTQQFNMSVTTQVSQDNITSMENFSIEQNDILSTTETITQTDAPQNTSTNSETIQTIDQSLDTEVTTPSNFSNVESTTILDGNIISQLNDETTLTPTTTEMQLEMTTSEITTVTNTQTDATTINIDTNITTNTITEAIATTIATQMIETTTPIVEVIDNSSVTTIRADDSEIMTNSTTITSIPTTIPTTNDPNLIAGFQDTTPSTAQRTAGTDVTTQPSSTITSPSSSTSELTTLAQSTTTNPTTVTRSSLSPLLSSSPSSSSPSPTPPSSTTTVKLAAASVTTTAPETTRIESTTASTITTQPATETTISTSTTPYLGRFGGSRITPAPRFSSSSSTRMPLRDYHIYGIYPNKTIVRKRPEDNLIDARNVDSPYVIFGIYPDGKLVRKFPNGTVIPDPPSNPVEVVFSLSTSTTTNRPQFPQQYNMFNQGTINNNNKNAASINNRPLDIIFNDGEKNLGYRSQLNIGLSGNSLSPNGDGPNQIAVPNLMSGMGNAGSQTTATTMITDVNSMPLQTSGPPSGVTPSSVNPQGGRIIQDIERDKASRTKEAGGQRSTVYIGQEKFINYWTDNESQNNSQVHSVKINSMTNALDVGPNPGSLPNLNILTNDQDQGRVTAPPGFPWKDPLDQIFGITTESPIGPSVASNTLDDPSPSRSAITDRTINPLVEVFTPMLNGAQLARDTSTTSATTNVPSTPSSTIQTTTTTTTTTTTRPTTTSTTTMTTTTTTTLPPQTTVPPTQMTTPLTTTILNPSSTELPFATQNLPQQTAFGSTFNDLAFLNSLSNHRSNSINSTPKTLTEVEQLLANKILSLALSKPGPTRSPKAIQSSNVSPNSLDGFTGFSNSQPIIIDLLRTTTEKPVVSNTASTLYTWRPIPMSVITSTTSYKPPIDTTSTTTTTTEKNVEITKPSTISTLTTGLPTTITTVQSTWKPLSTNTPTTNSPQIITSTKQTTQKPLNRKPVTAKPTQRPRPIATTQQPLGFGAGLLQAIFGRNIFAPPPTQRPLSNTRRPVATTKKIVQTTVKPISTTRGVENEVTTVKSTSTFSPEDDAKFLLQLLNAANKDVKGNDNKAGSSALALDDEKFLRAILSGEAKVRTPAPSTNKAVTLSNAALLAELLKAEGIEPTTPINQLREQLQASGPAKPSMSTEQPRTVKTTPRKLVTTRPRPNERSPTSTYPPPLFSNFNFGLPRGQINSEETSNDSPSTRNQVLNAAIGATRLFSQFLGSAITGAAQQLQSFVRNGTRRGLTNSHNRVWEN